MTQPAIALLAAATMVVAQASEPPPSLPSDPTFLLRAHDGGETPVQIRGCDPQTGLRVVQDGKERALPWDDLYAFTARDHISAVPAERSWALLPDGDRLVCGIDRADDAALHLRTASLGPLDLPIGTLLGLVFVPPVESDDHLRLARLIRDPGRKGESVWLANGDQLTGGFLGLGDRAISWQSEAARVDIDRNAAQALGLDPGAVQYPAPDGPYLEVSLTDGSRLGVEPLRVERGILHARSRARLDFAIALKDIARILVRSARVRFLSDIEPDAAQYVGYLGAVPPMTRDANIDGLPLTLQGRAYDHGLGTQSRTLLAFRLEPKHARLQALVGLDDRAGPLGGVVFRVLVDGKPRFTSPIMRANDTPKAIDLDIRGAHTLILATEFGDRGDVRDLADWVEPRLLIDRDPQPEPR